MFQTLEDVIAINNKERKKTLHKTFVVARILMDFLSWTLIWRTWSLFFFYHQNTAKKDWKLWKKEKKHLSAKLYLETISHDSWKTNNKKRILSCVLKGGRSQASYWPQTVSAGWWAVNKTRAFVSWEKKLIAFFFSKAESPCVNHWQGPT